MVYTRTQRLHHCRPHPQRHLQIQRCASASRGATGRMCTSCTTTEGVRLCQCTRKMAQRCVLGAMDDVLFYAHRVNDRSWSCPLDILVMRTRRVGAGRADGPHSSSDGCQTQCARMAYGQKTRMIAARSIVPPVQIARTARLRTLRRDDVTAGVPLVSSALLVDVSCWVCDGDSILRSAFCSVVTRCSVASSALSIFPSDPSQAFTTLLSTNPFYHTLPCWVRFGPIVSHKWQGVRIEIRSRLQCNGSRACGKGDLRSCHSPPPHQTLHDLESAGVLLRHWCTSFLQAIPLRESAYKVGAGIQAASISR